MLPTAMPLQRTILDQVTIAVSADIRYEVYWRQDEGGDGPAASVYAFDLEILRLDLFGEDRGHLHFDVGGAVGTRLWFPPGTMRDHVERGAFELGHNLRAYLQISRDERCNRLGAVGALDPELPRKAADEARSAMLRMLDERRPSS